MIRTQISLTEQQMTRAKQVAAARSVSLAALLRLALDRYLAEDEWERKVDRAKRAVGGFRSGHPDLARDHDQAIAERERW